MGWIFLSHNSLEKQEVERLAHALADRGLDPWLDKWNLVAGRPWIPAIEAAIEGAAAMCVCVGPQRFGPVHDMERQVAQAGSFGNGRPVIPVILPGGDPGTLPSFLKALTWIDGRQGDLEQIAAHIDASVRGLGLRPGRPGSTVCPYRGLEAFREEHARQYRGREEDVQESLRRLRHGRILTIAGPSGSGKSSLLHAGIVPAIRTGELDQLSDWTVVSMRPGMKPLHELALAIEVAAGRSDTKSLENLEGELADRPATFANAIDLMAGHLGNRVRVLVAVDQLEEVFTQSSPPDARAFLAALVHLGTQGSHRAAVVTTVRADFLERCLLDPTLAPTLGDSLQLLPPMTADALLRAVEQPARQAGIEIDGGLAWELVQGVAGEVGDLPLLQFSLEELWRQREGNRITWRAYHAMGGLKGAVARKADELFSSLGSAERQDVLRRVFLRLVHPGDGVPDTRTRELKETLLALDSDAPYVLECLIEARLLTVDVQHVDIAHEALLRAWGTLRRWIDASRDSIRLQEELRVSVDLWMRNGLNQDWVWSGARLSGALELQADGRLSLAPNEAKFLDASQTECRLVEDRREEARRRELEHERERTEAERKRGRLLKRFVAVTSVMLVVAIGAGAFAWAERSRALLKEAEAVQGRNLAESRRQQAVATVNEIVTSLNRELKSLPGSASIQKTLLVRAKQLLIDLGATTDSPSDPRVLRSWVVAHRERGVVAMKYDNLALARSEFEAAQQIASRLHESFRADPEMRRELAESISGLGDVAKQEGNLAAARDAYLKSLDLCKVQYDTDRTNAIVRSDLALAYQRVGTVAGAQGDLGAARDYYSRCLELLGELSEDDPTNLKYREYMSEAYYGLGGVSQEMRESQKAIDAYSRSVELVKGLHNESPTDVNLGRQLAASYGGLGAVALATGRLVMARDSYTKALVITKALCKSDPTRLELQHDLVLGLGRLTDVAFAEGNMQAAGYTATTTLGLARELHERDQANSSFRLAVVNAEFAMARAQKMVGDPKGARAHLNVAKNLIAAIDQAKMLVGGTELARLRARLRLMERVLDSH